MFVTNHFLPESDFTADVCNKQIHIIKSVVLQAHIHLSLKQSQRAAPISSWRRKLIEERPMDVWKRIQVSMNWHCCDWTYRAAFLWTDTWCFNAIAEPSSTCQYRPDCSVRLNITLDSVTFHELFPQIRLVTKSKDYIITLLCVICNECVMMSVIWGV